MCGIGGFVGKPYSQDELRTKIMQVCHSLRHRGPDDQGHFVGQNVALGSARLAIRDLTLGKQPMTKNDVSIVFNGEIYNTALLRESLKPNRWQTESDTEVILEGYMRDGVDSFNKLAGMFAFAIWDGAKKTLFLVRDRWGEKPLYYASTSRGLAFASEITGLKPWDDLQWEVSLPDILAFLAHSYIPTPCCGWRGIFKLEPGCYLKWREERHVIKRYHIPHVRSKDQDGAELGELLLACVKQCAVSDRPIGTFLSGGIDSSTITFCLRQCILTFPVYSIDWQDPGYSENKYSTLVCKTLGLQHHLITCDARFILEHFDTIVACYGEPFADESMLPTFCLAKRAKKDVDVVLTGDGADEFFHGYERYFFKGSKGEYGDVFCSMDHKTRKVVLTQELEKFSAFTPSLDLFKGWKIEKMNSLRARSLADIQRYLPDDILTKVDRATMFFGLEARAPFLMPQITDFALNTSIKQLAWKEKQGKWILRKAMEKVLPKPILYRKKQGFGVPLKHWFSNQLQSWMRERLLSGVLLESGLFSHVGLEKISQRPHRYSRAIFNLLVLESWWRQNMF